MGRCGRKPNAHCRYYCTVSHNKPERHLDKICKRLSPHSFPLGKHVAHFNAQWTFLYWETPIVACRAGMAWVLCKWKARSHKTTHLEHAIRVTSHTCALHWCISTVGGVRPQLLGTHCALVINDASHPTQCCSFQQNKIFHKKVTRHLLFTLICLPLWLLWLVGTVWAESPNARESSEY